jgi:hypothetical protein
MKDSTEVRNEVKEIEIAFWRTHGDSIMVTVYVPIQDRQGSSRESVCRLGTATPQFMQLEEDRLDLKAKYDTKYA